MDEIGCFVRGMGSGLGMGSLMRAPDDETSYERHAGKHEMRTLVRCESDWMGTREWCST